MHFAHDNMRLLNEIQLLTRMKFLRFEKTFTNRNKKNFLMLKKK